MPDLSFWVFLKNRQGLKKPYDSEMYYTLEYAGKRALEEHKEFFSSVLVLSDVLVFFVRQDAEPNTKSIALDSYYLISLLSALASFRAKRPIWFSANWELNTTIEDVRDQERKNSSATYEHYVQQLPKNDMFPDVVAEYDKTPTFFKEGTLITNE